MEEVVVLYEYSAQLPDELSLRVGDVITRVERLEGGWWRGELASNTGMFPDNFVKVLPVNSSNDKGEEKVTLRNKKRCRVLFSYQPVHEDELELKVDQVVELLSEVEDGWWKGRLAGRVGVFPSNFVEMCNEEKDKFQVPVEERNKKNSVGANVLKENLEADSTKDPADIQVQAGKTHSKPETETTRKMSASQRSQIGPESPPPDAAPRLPPKPVKDQCMVLFPYTAQNEDELSLAEGQLITIITKDCEDKGWWKGELDGRVGVFPDNFVKRVSQNISEEIKQVLPETPEKPKSAGLKSSPSKDSIKNLFETHNSLVISKATSFEKLKPVDSNKNEEDKNPEKVNRSNKISEINRKVSNIRNELSKSDLFKSSNKSEAPKPKVSSSSGSRASLSSIASETEKLNIKDVKRRVSEPIKTEDLDDITTTTKLSHPTASRAKAPKRRPPSQHFLKENIPDLQNEEEIEVSNSKEVPNPEEQKEKVVETEEVINKTRAVETAVPSRTVGGVQVMPTAKSSPDSRPSWMEEFSRKKANRKSGIFAEKVEEDAGKSGSKSAEKPTPPKAETKPSIAHKPEQELVEMRKNLSRDNKSQSSLTEPVKERPARPSLPPSLLVSTQPEKRSSDLVRHSSHTSELARTGQEKKHAELVRKHSDSSRHSDKTDKPTVHSTNLGNPEKFSFAKPERPVMDKVIAKNDRNVAKSESGEAPIGWKSEIISNRVTDILATKETNGYKSLQEKENISGSCSCKELQDLKNSFIEIQTEFQLQVKALRSELEEEKQARVKLEAEVRALKKLIHKP